MEDRQKTKKQLIADSVTLRQQITKSRALKAKRNRVQHSLVDSELRYRRLFEAAQDGILILDGATGQIIDVNPFLANLLGYSHKDFLGKRLWEIGPFKDVEQSKDAYLELQKNDYVRYEHLPLGTKGGQKVAVEFVSNVYFMDHVRVIQCNIRDITERRRIEEELEIQAITDALTGVLNRRGIMQRLEGEFSRSDRENNPLSVALLDIDHFKLVNDTYGHAAGDTVLRVVAKQTKNMLRKYDHIGRFGGDEFLLIIPGVDADKAKNVFERLRSTIEERGINYAGTVIRVTVSLGVVSCSGSGSLDRLTILADQALYQAKNNGRNRVEYLMNLPTASCEVSMAQILAPSSLSNPLCSA